MAINLSWDAIKEKMPSNVKQKNSDVDERLWALTKDKDGNGSAVVKLLPGKRINGEDTAPVVKLFKHEIFLKKANGSWGVYKNLSPQNIKQDCPVSDAYNELKGSGVDEYEKLSASIGRRTQYLSNVYIENDIGASANSGQIKIWTYGKMISDQIWAELEPSEQQQKLGIKPKNLFDLPASEGLIVSVSGKRLDTKFTIKINEKKEWWDETKSLSILENDCHNLEEFLDPKKYSDYETLRKEFARAISGTSIEKALLAINSKVITKPYARNDGNRGSTAGAIPSSTTETPVSTTTETPVSTTTETPVSTSPTTETSSNKEELANILKGLET